MCLCNSVLVFVCYNRCGGVAQRPCRHLYLGVCVYVCTYCCQLYCHTNLRQPLPPPSRPPPSAPQVPPSLPVHCLDPAQWPLTAPVLHDGNHAASGAACHTLSVPGEVGKGMCEVCTRC